MGLFRSLFGNKKNKSGQTAATKSHQEQEPIEALMESGKKFDHEIIEAFQRYYSDPTLSVSIEIKDDKGNIYPPHMVYEELFAEWAGIRSKWDRMSLLYKFWDESQPQRPEHWQVLERYTKDRYPKIALRYLEEFLKDKENFEAKELVAISKMYRSMIQNGMARKYIEEAYRRFPDEDPVQVEYATVLHLSENHNERENSHKIFQKVLEKKLSKEDTESLFGCFLFSEDYIDSSVFALSYLIAAEAAPDQWDVLAEEYYYCPLFRYEHAVKLSKSGEPLRALAKLTSLSQEFPWFEKAVETTISNIHSMRIQMNSPEFMEKELREFQSQTNG
ncbi:hypothetical protein [uncultured Chryseobacterium sp.]|uniref:hypothetical protein n=1 Tax=uncultured Chryseobacterium sp. TaxID=259322 RepID=UPI0025ED1E7C|nr:hypothetical protein [uncultured Chryseobacterium sp.]